jgi:hypothetical protein
MYEKLFLVSAAQLDKINETKTPALDYSELYSAIVKSKSAKEEEPALQAPSAKLKLQEWLYLYHGENS